MDPLADDLVLLCWDGARGKVQPRCAQRLPAAVGGALLLDGVFGGWLVVEDDRVLAPQGADVDGVRDPLVAEVVERVATRRRPPKVARMVAWAGSSRRVAAVRRRLVERGTLRAETVPKERREAARERAEDLAEGHGLPEEVGEAVQRAQAAATAAVATAGAGVVAGGAG